MRTAKIISAVIILFLLFSEIPSAAVAAGGGNMLPGSPANAGEWAQPEIKALYARGIYSDYLFSDYDKSITRAEFTALIVNLYEYSNGTIHISGASHFTDTKNHTYTREIEKAYYIGLIKGESDGTFNPDGLITREQAAKILYSAITLLKGAAVASKSGLELKDGDDISGWAVPYVYYVVENNILQSSGAEFRPRDNLTRGQAMLTAERLIERYGIRKFTIPQYRALLVGISDYAGTGQDGSRYKNSIDAIAAVLKNSNLNNKHYDVTVEYSTNREAFLKSIGNTFEGAKENDVSVFVFSGHGVLNESFFGEKTSSDAEMVVSDGASNYFVSYRELLKAFDNIPGKKILLIGSCYSGTAIKYLNSGKNDYFILTASDPDAESYGYVSPTDSYNFFEQEVADGCGFNGSLEADENRDGIVSFDELYKFVKANVRLSTVNVYDNGNSVDFY